MTTAGLLASLFFIGFILAIFVISWIRKTRGQRKSVEYLAHLLQNVNEHKEDLELAIDPNKQEALKAEWLSDISRSQVCYRRDVSRWLDLLEEYYGRMRRNGIVVLETVEGEAESIRKIQEEGIREAQRKLADFEEIIELLSAEGLDLTVGVQLKALTDRFRTFLNLVRFTRANQESVAQVLGNLGRTSRGLMRGVDSEFEGNEDVQGIVNALVETARQLLDCFVLLNQNLEVYLKLRELAEVTAEFLNAVRWPLVFVWAWSRVPLESWKFIPVPTLSEYGQCRGVSVLVAYDQMKAGVVRVANLLYPGFPAVAERIESTM